MSSLQAPLARAGTRVRVVWGMHAIRIVTLLGLLSLWQWLSTFTDRFGEVVPGVQRIGAALVQLMSSADTYGHAAVTGKELGLGLAIGLTFALPAGLTLALVPSIRYVCEPLVIYAGAIPKIVLYPIFVWFLGIGLESKVGMATASVAFPVLVQTAGAAWSIRPIFRDVARILHMRPLQRFRYVYLPSMLPDVYTGIRLGIATGIIGTLLAETKASNEGLGFLMTHYYSTFRVPEMYAVLLLIFMVATLVAFSMDRLDRRIRQRRGSPRNAGVAL